MYIKNSLHNEIGQFKNKLAEKLNGIFVMSHDYDKENFSLYSHKNLLKNTFVIDYDVSKVTVEKRDKLILEISKHSDFNVKDNFNGKCFLTLNKIQDSESLEGIVKELSEKFEDC